MTGEQFERLKKPFLPSEVQWRFSHTIQNDKGLSGLAVPYLDSRAIQRRLDEVVGYDNWQNSFVAVTTATNGDPAAYVCSISIYSAERGEWISKSNGAGNTDIEAVKGGLSDAFKRAASMWGIGRYLYCFEGVWVNVEQKGKSKVIAKTEQQKLDRVYNDTVKRLFPLSISSQTNTAPAANPVPVSVNQIPQQPQFQQPILQQSPSNHVYTVIDAQFKKTHTTIMLTDGANDYKVFYNGEAKLAKNQRITGVITEKENSKGRFLALENYRVADYSEYCAAA